MTTPRRNPREVTAGHQAGCGGRLWRRTAPERMT